MPYLSSAINFEDALDFDLRLHANSSIYLAIRRCGVLEGPSNYASTSLLGWTRRMIQTD
jgi:hypothetical protein